YEPWPPFCDRRVKQVANADRGVANPEQSPTPNDFRVDIRTERDNQRRGAIQGERNVSAGVVIEAPRNPPQRAAEPETEEDERRARYNCKHPARFTNCGSRRYQTRRVQRYSCRSEHEHAIVRLRNINRISI